MIEGSSAILKEKGYHLRFMLQAYASMYFNEYVLQRWEKGLHLLEGDIMVNRYYAEGAKVGVYRDGEIIIFDYHHMKKEHLDTAMWEPSLFHSLGRRSYKKEKWIPTGPLLGRNLLIAPKGSKANVREHQLFTLAQCNEQTLNICKMYQLRGVRRPLWVQIDDLEWKFEGDDIVLHFSLPTGSYATVLIAFILTGLDTLTLKDNKLEIPRISRTF
ncbi:MAG: tRNA pseudouridine(13) synthase TruD [Candidatus Peribacteria bacterium]|nr:tRNA pseudouridine(13) synthase TruD [Candidatus Peribacteria bacterium]